MNWTAAAEPADQRRLVWCTVFASLFKFQTKCDSIQARAAAARAFERLGAGEPFSAVQAMINGELTWPVGPEEQ